MKFETEHAGRQILVEVDERDREFDQFCVTVSVGGKERWTGWFSDHKAEEPVHAD